MPGSDNLVARIVDPTNTNAENSSHDSWSSHEQKVKAETTPFGYSSEELLRHADEHFARQSAGVCVLLTIHCGNDMYFTCCYSLQLY